MNHLNEEQLVEAYYGELDASSHLKTCAECRLQLEHLSELLDSVRENTGPPIDEAAYSAAVWAQLSPKLLPHRRIEWRGWWTLSPVFAVLLVIAFLSGRLVERNHDHLEGISEKARERVLLISLSEHLQQSEIVLTNVANANPGSSDLLAERARARELLGTNRLLRQTASRLGDLTDASLLDEVERLLVDVADSPLLSSSSDLARIQQRIAAQGLLFRVRISSSATRERGQRL